jgi:Transposase DDE domain group 1
MSSDGGIIVLCEIAVRLGLGDVVSGPLGDERDPARIHHSYGKMVSVRMLAIAAGYENCDDLDVLRSDPVFKNDC